MDSQTIVRWLSEAGREINVQAEHLSALDAALGDGDHGTNMNRGFGEVAKLLRERGPGERPGELLTAAGKTLISTIGGASGALWGFALRRAGRALGEAETFDGYGLADALDAMVGGVVELGRASVGDKTMLDALQPAATALREQLDAGADVELAIAEASKAARAGADATAQLEARIGRASFLGERSIGHEDPSANSAAILIAALHVAVVDEARS